MRYTCLVTFLAVALCDLGVGAPPAWAATYYVAPTGSDSNSGSSAAPWRSLQKAAATMAAGDTSLIADGEYPGGIVQSRAGTAAAPITFRAVHPGVPIVRGDQTADRDAFYVTEADHVVVEGLTITKANRAGIRVSLSNFVTIRDCKLLNNARWGIFTDYSDDLLLECNECAGSAIEHGIYVSNSGDRPVIRYNLVHDNHASGIQINADPALLEPSLGTRGDGITEHAVIEGNIVSDNGAAGGAAINLASVRSSRIVNNLLYGNKAGGISGWDDGDGTEWGCRENAILQNTVYFRPGEGRYCVSLKNGSTDNVVQNNLLHGGARGAIEYDNDSSVRSDGNLLYRADSAKVVNNEDTEITQSLAEWQAASGNDLHSVSAAPLFLNTTTVPYDFHLQPGSPALDRGLDRPDVTVDLEGVARPQNGHWDLGCYERTGSVSSPPPTPAPTPDPTPAVVLPPTNLTATGGPKRVTLTWTQSASPKIVKNRIYRATTPGGPYQRIATVSARTRYVDSGRRRNVTFYYHVTAVDASGRESATSAEVSARTQ